MIDISHESLMRVWRRLDAWADEEARSAQTYRRLTETAALHAVGRASLWRDPELQLALDWRDANRPNETWALRYYSGFASAMDFLTQSSEAREAERAERERQRQSQREFAAEQEKAKAQARFARRMRWAAFLSGTLGMLAVIAALLAGWASLRERDAQKIAAAEAVKANASMLLAQDAEALARKSEALARELRGACAEIGGACDDVGGAGARGRGANRSCPGPL